MEKINLKKELLAVKNQTKTSDPETNFHLYALVDLVSTDNFINDLNSTKKQYDQEQSEQETHEHFFDKGYQLGIDKLIVVDPIYEDYTFKSDVDLLKSEKRKMQISESYTKNFKRLDLGIQILDPKSLTTSDVEKYNDLALIKDWMSEVLDHDGIDMISSTRYEMAEVRNKYDSDHFLFSGIYGYKARKEFSAGHYIMLGTVYLSPIVLVDLLAVHNYFEMVSIEINSETDKIEMLDIQVVNLKAYSKIIRSYIYNVLYQIQAKK